MDGMRRRCVVFVALLVLMNCANIGANGKDFTTPVLSAIADSAWTDSSDTSDGGSGSGSGNIEEDNEVSLIFGGDLNFDGPQRRMEEKGNCTYRGYVSQLKKLFDGADIKLCNMESPVSEDLSKEHPAAGGNKVQVLAHARSVRAVSWMHAVLLANNHVMDWGERVTDQTTKTLRANHISYIGLTEGRTKLSEQTPVIMERKGLKFGFLGYCMVDTCIDQRAKFHVGAAVYDTALMKLEVGKLKKRVDFVVVLVHWGVEYEHFPPTYQKDSQLQRSLEMRDAGVALVVGAHPHISQPHSYYGRTLVVYSLGNLLFNHVWTNGRIFLRAVDDQTSEREKDGHLRKWARQHRKIGDLEAGKLVKVVFSKRGIVREKTQWIPINSALDTNNCMRPTSVAGQHWRGVCSPLDPECLGSYTDAEVDELLDGVMVPRKETKAVLPKYQTLDEERKTNAELWKIARQERQKEKEKEQLIDRKGGEGKKLGRRKTGKKAADHSHR